MRETVEWIGTSLACRKMEGLQSSFAGRRLEKGRHGSFYDGAGTSL